MQTFIICVPDCRQVCLLNIVVELWYFDGINGWLYCWDRSKQRGCVAQLRQILAPNLGFLFWLCSQNYAITHSILKYIRYVLEWTVAVSMLLMGVQDRELGFSCLRTKLIHKHSLCQRHPQNKAIPFHMHIFVLSHQPGWVGGTLL